MAGNAGSGLESHIGTGSMCHIVAPHVKNRRPKADESGRILYCGDLSCEASMVGCAPRSVCSLTRIFHTLSSRNAGECRQGGLSWPFAAETV